MTTLNAPDARVCPVIDALEPEQAIVAWGAFYSSASESRMCSAAIHFCFSLLGTPPDTYKLRYVVIL
eukprot:4159908-Pleurochrysis_carterae.AAC.1